VGEAGGHEQLVVALVVQREGLPLDEAGRQAADVDDDVEDPPARASHVLGQPVLVVHPAQDAARRARVVVLDERRVDAEALERRCAERLDEEAAIVPVDRRFEQDRAFQARVEASHRRPEATAPATAWRAA
jgi:hypothetical protein